MLIGLFPARKSARNVSRNVCFSVASRRNGVERFITPTAMSLLLVLVGLTLGCLREVEIAPLSATEAINHLHKLRGQCRIDRRRTPAVCDEVDLRDTRAGDGDVQSLRALPEVRSVYLDGTQVTDIATIELSELKHLKCLSLGDTAITDRGLVFLRALPQLEMLSLASTKVTDRGVAHLAELPNLTMLNLSGTSISDASLAQLQKIKNLKELFVTDTRISAAGVQTLKENLPNALVMH